MTLIYSFITGSNFFKVVAKNRNYTKTSIINLALKEFFKKYYQLLFYVKKFKNEIRCLIDI